MHSPQYSERQRLNPVTLKQRRIDLGLSSSEFAQQIGIPEAHIELAERVEVSAEVTFLLNLTLSLLEAAAEENDQLARAV